MKLGSDYVNVSLGAVAGAWHYSRSGGWTWGQNQQPQVFFPATGPRR